MYVWMYVILNNQYHNIAIHNILVSLYLMSLYREGLITFGCSRVYDIVLFRWPDSTSPQGFVPPHCPYTLGRKSHSN